MSQWSAFPLQVPEDKSLVWVRLTFNPSQPFVARWDLPTQSFITEGSLLTFPWWSVQRWKPTK